MSASTHAGYRVKQFFRALTAHISEEDLTRAARFLTPDLLALFRTMSAQDQRHCLKVWAALREDGHTDCALLTAALLHDVGKASAPLSVWQRAIVVLLERFAPRMLGQLTRADATSAAARFWRPLLIYARHAEIGAQMAQQAGCSPLVVTLIRRHQQYEPTENEFAGASDRANALLTALQQADNLN
jgi:putative nucleotidyltransferase with HDIG domain